MELSTDYMMKVSTWEKKLPELFKDNNYKWIATNHKKIYEYITKHYTNKNTLKGHISVLAGILRTLDTLPLIQKKYSKISTDLCLELQNESKKQELSPQRKENFVFLDDFIKRREQFKQLFEQDKTNNKNNLSWVLLSLYTYQPPIRMEYKSMEIVSVLPKNKKQNYLLNKNGKYYVVIRDDKVIKSHGPAQFELSNELNNVINISLEAFPRKYILSTQREGSKQIGKQGFESLLKQCFSPQRVTVDILRSAYITHFYSDPRKTLAQKEDLAKLMRHSAIIAQREYQKIDIQNVAHPDNLVITSNMMPQLEIEQPVVQNKTYFDLKQWRKIYREKNREQINNTAREEYKNNKDAIIRRHILFNLNKSKNTKQPKKESIERYNLKFDENLKRWV